MMEQSVQENESSFNDREQLHAAVLYNKVCKGKPLSVVIQLNISFLLDVNQNSTPGDINIHLNTSR